MNRRALRKAIGPLMLLGAVLLTLTAAQLVSRQFFERADAERSLRPPSLASARRPAREAGHLTFKVTALQGEVHTQHEGRWYLVQAGDLLASTDVIRTRRGSRVVLRRGGSELDIHENVDLRLDDVAPESANFGVLRGGRLLAQVGSGREKLIITAHAATSSNDGAARWIIQAHPDGQVSVATTQGQVRFAARGKEVLVGAGFESSAGSNNPPAAPGRIPEDLLLSVVWPELEAAPADTEVRGTVRASSRVRVNGHDVPVDADGRFAIPVRLQVGNNTVEVAAEDIAGRTKVERKTLHRPPAPPKLEAMDEEIWQR